MTIAFVKEIGSAFTTGTSATTRTITVPLAGVAAGNSIILNIVASGGIAVSSVTDTQGNTYTIDNTTANGTTLRTTTVAAHNVTALTILDIITITFASAAHSCALALEYSGLAASSTLDQTQVGTGSGSTTPTTAATATTAQDDELLIGAIGYSGAPTTFTAGSGYTARSQVASTGTQRNIASEDRIVSATGAYVADGVFGNGKTYAALISTYKAAVAVSGKPLGIHIPVNAPVSPAWRQ